MMGEPHSTVMTVVVIFNGRCKKNVYIFVIKLKFQVRLSMQSLHRYTLLMVWDSQLFFKSGDEAEVAQYPFKFVKID